MRRTCGAVYNGRGPCRDTYEQGIYQKITGVFWVGSGFPFVSQNFKLCCRSGTIHEDTTLKGWMLRTVTNQRKVNAIWEYLVGLTLSTGNHVISSNEPQNAQVHWWKVTWQVKFMSLGLGEPDGVPGQCEEWYGSIASNQDSVWVSQLPILIAGFENKVKLMLVRMCSGSWFVLIGKAVCFVFLRFSVCRGVFSFIPVKLFVSSFLWISECELFSFAQPRS